ncbi:MAG: ABC transporter permease [Thermoflexaceae bacterium]|nr:ABC transporter permease [Thermoflexaceae bacterium]
MLVIENILLALSSLLANKMRALLTMLGIIIGIGSVIAIMSVGNSISNSVTSSMEGMGSNNITVGLQQKSTTEEVSANGRVFEGFNRGSQMKDEDYLTDEMIDALFVDFDGEVSAVFLEENIGSGTAVQSGNEASVTLTGMNQSYLQNQELEILYGRSLTERDQEEAKRVVLVADDLVEELFAGDNAAAYGSEIAVYTGSRYYYYTIVGIYDFDEDAASYSGISSSTVTTPIYMPFQTARDQNHNTKGYTQFTVQAASGMDAEALSDNLENWFNVNYYRNNDSFEVNTFSMSTIISSMSDMLSTISVAISVIAGISLLVGGIGVMNIMLVSITERTREIGTRKALGATNGSIRFQFIMESIVICLLGGVIGIVLGLVLSVAATSMLGFEASPSIPGIIFAVTFSIVIGVFFGYYPANKAAKMDPIEALRYE